MKTITTTGNITSLRSRADKSIGITFVTSELNPLEKAYFFELHNENVSVVITPLDRPSEVYTVNKEIEDKSPSVRMRNVLYLLWKQNPEEYQDFDSYYRQKMEGFIEHLKTKLEQEL